MRLHRSERLQKQWYGLPPEIRRFVEELKVNPRRDDCAVPHRPNLYEDFVGGKWVIWEVDDSKGETVIRVTFSDLV